MTKIIMSTSEEDNAVLLENEGPETVQLVLIGPKIYEIEIRAGDTAKFSFQKAD